MALGPVLLPCKAVSGFGRVRDGPCNIHAGPMTCSPEAALATRPRTIGELSTLIRQALVSVGRSYMVNEMGQA